MKRALVVYSAVTGVVVIASLFAPELGWYQLGVKMGNAAIILLWITCVPGILKRFRAKGRLQRVQIFIMKDRRWWGVATFTTALAHEIWVRMLLYIKNGVFPQPWNFPLFEMLGMTAFLLMIPLILTSNNYAVRKLRKWWQRIHYLIYPTMWILAFHISLSGAFFPWGLGTFTIASLQLASWIWYSGSLWKNQSSSTRS